MFFACDLNFDSSDEERKDNLILERKLLRKNSDIFKLPDEKFENYFRLNKIAFKHVLETIECDLKNGVRSTFISKKIKLAATSRFLAQESYQLSLGNDFNLGLSQPIVSKILDETLIALENKVCPQWIKFDMTAFNSVAISSHFDLKLNGIVPLRNPAARKGSFSSNSTSFSN